MTDLAQLTTLRVGGPAATFVEVASEADFIDAVREADASGTPLLVIGGGSNLLVADAGFDGVVVRDTRQSMEVQDDGFCGGVSLTIAAGTAWDDVVAKAVAEGWVGVETLAGIPGSAGAAPVQNIGAYGAELSETLATVRVWDREQGKVRTLFAVELGFGYRDSVLKRSLVDGYGPTPRYVVLDVTLQMRFGTRSAPVRYAQLASALDVPVGETALTADVRAAVLDLRRSKGMVLDAADPDTWSAGSFFTNPVVDEAQLSADAPRYPVAGGATDVVKTSAAWLIEHAGFGKGFALEGSRAGLSTKHTLAVTNRGGSSTAELVALARHVRDGVLDRFGFTLEPEPVLVGVTL
jgi:UDP-N-acetylmuramate dehydrogenase